MLETRLIRASSRDSRRLLIILHGLGDSMEGYSWVPRALGFPWLNCLFVNAPDSYYGGWSWYDYPGEAAPGVRRSMKLLNELLDAQPGQGFPPEQTMLFGFSQGCLMTLETGLRRPQPLAGLIGVSGYVLDPAALLREAPPVARQQRVLVTHGRQDPLIPCVKVKKQMEELQTGGIQIEWHEFEKVHTIVEEELPLFQSFMAGSFPS